jgi:hypothetical protein
MFGSPLTKKNNNPRQVGEVGGYILQDDPGWQVVCAVPREVANRWAASVIKGDTDRDYPLSHYNKEGIVVSSTVTEISALYVADFTIYLLTRKP